MLHEIIQKSWFPYRFARESIGTVSETFYEYCDVRYITHFEILLAL